MLVRSADCSRPQLQQQLLVAAVAGRSLAEVNGVVLMRGTRSFSIRPGEEAQAGPAEASGEPVSPALLMSLSCQRPPDFFCGLCKHALPSLKLWTLLFWVLLLLLLTVEVGRGGGGVGEGGVLKLSLSA